VVIVQVECFVFGFRDFVLWWSVIIVAQEVEYNFNYVGGDIVGGLLILW